MNQHKNKQRWQLVLFICAVVIGFASLWYTNALVKKMATQEKLKAEMLASAWMQIVNSEPDDSNLDFFAGVIEDNHTIPVMVTDSLQQLIFHRNLNVNRMANPRYMQRTLDRMKAHATPIDILLAPGEHQYLYYDQSVLLTRLAYYPYIQLGIVMLFILVAYFAFRTSRKFSENQLWVGLSKETAHQLGTPISSLMAWVEMMKIRDSDQEMMTELEKDVNRLEKITERFSKIGSKPVLEAESVMRIIERAVNYIKSRSSGKIRFGINTPGHEIIVPLNAALFEWVIENLCKNAIDAMQGQGNIDIVVTDSLHHVQIDIRDTGKGIPKNMFGNVFKAGYTTKQKGWGLGLSLVKRIVEEYHAGRVFVSQSELNKGTVFRIILKK